MHGIFYARNDRREKYTDTKKNVYIEVNAQKTNLWKSTCEFLQGQCKRDIC